MPSLPTASPTDNIRRYFTESCNTITSHAIITDEISVGTYRLNFRRIYSVGNVPAGNFFLARAYLSVRSSVFRRWVFFLFARDLATEMEFTDDWYTDGRVPSVRPSVIISPTDFIAVTDRISPSVKLDNVVVSAGMSLSFFSSLSYVYLGFAVCSFQELVYVFFKNEVAAIYFFSLNL
jgi:hypothetical protein